MQARFDTCLDGLLPDGGAVLLAVSGGIDSMVMADLASKSVHKFAVAHCNFHLRGTESDGDETFVREWAAKKGIPYYKKDFDTDEYASTHPPVVIKINGSGVLILVEIYLGHLVIRDEQSVDFFPALHEDRRALSLCHKKIGLFLCLGSDRDLSCHAVRSIVDSVLILLSGSIFSVLRC